MRRGRGKEHREVKDERISGNLNDQPDANAIL